MLTSRYKDAFNRAIAPLARQLARSGISPSTFTLAGPLLGSIVCWGFVRTRAVLPFCVLMSAIGCLDAVDGALARASGRVTRFGSYLDALCDRYVEVMAVLAAAAVTGYWALSLVFLSGSLLVSYAKARAAMEVPVTNQEWPDLMERTERDVGFIVGLAASRLIAWRPLGRDLFWWTLAILSILVHATVLQRALRARRLIGARSQ